MKYPAKRARIWIALALCLTLLTACTSGGDQKALAESGAVIDSVFASLAESDADAVLAVGDITNEVMSKVAVKKLTKGGRVDLADNAVTIDLSIMMGFGYPIPETSRQVQEKVKNSVETMTGLTVEDVNIRVASVNMAKVK